MVATGWALLFLFAQVVNFLAVRKIRKGEAIIKRQEQRIKELEWACDVAWEAYNGLRQIVKAGELNAKAQRDEELRQAYSRRAAQEAERLHREIEDMTGGQNGRA